MGKDYDKYLSLRVKRNIKWKMIVFEKEQIEKDLVKKYPKINEFRLVTIGKAPKNGNFNIFGEESVILHSATEPMIIEVKNPTLVRVFQNIFDILWSIGKPL